MFKAGDKVRRTTASASFRKGAIYTVFKPHPTLHKIQIEGVPGNWNVANFELVKKAEPREPPKTEIEWLDRVRDNFKE